MTELKVQNIIVLIGGGHASGKYTTAKLLEEEIPISLPHSNLCVELIDLKEFETKVSDSITERIDVLSIRKYTSTNDLYKPSRFDFERLKNYLGCNRSSSQGQQKIFLVHGLYALYDKELRDMSQIKIFITSDPDTRLIRWIRRDVLNDSGNNMGLEDVLHQYLSGAKDEMNNFIFPTKEFADVIMPRGAETNAVKLIIDGIIPFLEKNSRPERAFLGHTTGDFLRPRSNDIFERENFNDQKRVFYELN